MNFPIINTIDDVLPAIKNHPEFVIKDNFGPYVSIDYIYADENTFDCPIRRECRGIKFSKDGKILARPYHKFFNLEEKEETKSDKINWNTPHKILEKLDGSMVHPALINGQLVWMTRAGETEISKAAGNWANENFGDRLELIIDLLEKNFTPIFEWCSPTNQIVLRYSTDRLIFTAIRHNLTGIYEEVYSHDIFIISKELNPISPTILKSFISDVRGLKNQEGYVIRFNNGFMIKLKADEYVLRHKIFSDFLFEKNVLEIVLKNLVDDVLLVLSDEMAEKFHQYSNAVNSYILYTATNLKEKVNSAFDLYNKDRKQFALNFVPSLNPLLKSIAFNILDGK